MIEIIENGKIMIHILVQEDRKIDILLLSSIDILSYEFNSDHLANTQYFVLLLK